MKRGWRPLTLVLFSAVQAAAGGARAQEVAVPAEAPQPPRLLNADRVSALLQDNYPMDLRQLGIGGLVRLKAYLNAGGKVDSVVVAVSSGVPALDQAAEGIVPSFEFSPPAQPLWIDVPVDFRPDQRALTEFSRLPQLLTRGAVQELARQSIPPRARGAGIAAEVPVIVEVDTAGTVLNAGVARSSCLLDFDAAALEAAGAMRFAPGDPGEAPSVRRTIVTFGFGGDSVSVRLPGDKAQADSVLDRRPAPARSGTPPELRNRDEVARELVRVYPPDLRDRRLGGTVVVWFLIDEKGRVVRRQVSKSSGECRLDVAALAVGEVMKFAPARLDGKPTKVRVVLPIGTVNRRTRVPSFIWLVPLWVRPDCGRSVLPCRVACARTCRGAAST